MTVKTVQQAFIEFEKDQVRVPSDQNDRAKEVHPVIRKAVEEHLGDLFVRAFLSGSYARRVQTLRLKDVDIIVVLNDPDGRYAESADAALERIRTAAKSCELTSSTRKGVRAIKIVLEDEEFTVDLVPALEDPLGELKLARVRPAENIDDWTAARPKGQLDAHWDKNKATNGIYVPAVRIVKFWNQRTKYNSKNALPSYLVEAILHGALTKECDYDDAVVGFFRAANTHLSIQGATVPCPGAPGNYVDALLDDQRREAALEKVKTALETAEAALAETDPAKATERWQKLFGPSFPSAAGETSALARSLALGTAVAVGAGVAAAAANHVKSRPVLNTRPWREG